MKRYLIISGVLLMAGVLPFSAQAANISFLSGDCTVNMTSSPISNINVSGLLKNHTVGKVTVTYQVTCNSAGKHVIPISSASNIEKKNYLYEGSERQFLFELNGSLSNSENTIINEEKGYAIIVNSKQAEIKNTFNIKLNKDSANLSYGSNIPIKFGVDNKKSVLMTYSNSSPTCSINFITNPNVNFNEHSYNQLLNSGISKSIEFTSNCHTGILYYFPILSFSSSNNISDDNVLITRSHNGTDLGIGIKISVDNYSYYLYKADHSFFDFTRRSYKININSGTGYYMYPINLWKYFLHKIGSEIGLSKANEPYKLKATLVPLNNGHPKWGKFKANLTITATQP